MSDIRSPPTIESRLDTATCSYQKLFAERLASSDGRRIEAVDLIVYGLVNRNLGLLRAMPPLFATRNLHALAPLLRVQLDGLLRLHGFRLVTQPEMLALHMLNGKPLRKFKDRDGCPLHDAHLVTTIKSELPWVSNMYQALSDWVHLSESHVWSAVSDGDTHNSIVVAIGSQEAPFPDQLFVAARAAVEMIHAATIGLIGALYLHRDELPAHAQTRR